MAFKRMEGFAGSVPQGFIDRSVKVCPFCGSNNPHWALDQKMQMKLEGNLYLFQCEQCKGVLSSPVPDVTGYNNTMLTLPACSKSCPAKRMVLFICVYMTQATMPILQIRLGRNTPWKKSTKWQHKKAALPIRAESSIDTYGAGAIPLLSLSVSLGYSPMTMKTPLLFCFTYIIS